MITKQQLIDRLTTIRDTMDTDFMNRYAIEGITKDINDLIFDCNTEIGSVGIDID